MGWQKVALLVLPKGRLCVTEQNQMCHLCGWLKLFLKKCGGGKNKKLRVGLSVGLLVARLKYGLYVGHLSKLAFHFMFKVVRLVVVVSSVRLACNGLQLGVRFFSSKKLTLRCCYGLAYSFTILNVCFKLSPTLNK